jgi:hypothetical protein
LYIANPSDYFDDCSLRESRVLGFTYNDSTGQIRLDVDYAAEVVSHWFEAKLAGVRLDEYQPLPSDFRRFTFCESSWHDIDSKSLLFQEHDPKYWMNIIRSHDVRLPIIAAFQFTRADDRFVAKIELDHVIHYQFSFAFRGLSVKRRRGRHVLADENRSLFEDIDNKCIFNFDEPFSDDC